MTLIHFDGVSNFYQIKLYIYLMDKTIYIFTQNRLIIIMIFIKWLWMAGSSINRYVYSVLCLAFKRRLVAKQLIKSGVPSNRLMVSLVIYITIFI